MALAIIIILLISAAAFLACLNLLESISDADTTGVLLSVACLLVPLCLLGYFIGTGG